MFLKSQAEDKVDHSILITGSARSGTTIIGKIIHSLENIEYVFEPPTLVSLFALINKLSKEDWKLLLQTYLYEDFFNGAIAARNLNFNKNDDSCIYNAKSESEIRFRLTGSLRKVEIEKLCSHGHIAYKIPDIVPFINTYLEIMPYSRIIFMKRNPIDTLNSLFKKHWFSDYSLNTENRIYPFQLYKNCHIPYWVPESDYDYWIELSEIDRCAYYYLRMYYPPINDRIYIMNYDEFIIDPQKHVDQLADFLNLKYGNLTNQIIKSVKKTAIKRNTAIIEQLSPKLKAQILDLY